MPSSKPSPSHLAPRFLAPPPAAAALRVREEFEAVAANEAAEAVANDARNAARLVCGIDRGLLVRAQLARGADPLQHAAIDLRRGGLHGMHHVVGRTEFVRDECRALLAGHAAQLAFIRSPAPAGKPASTPRARP